MRAYHIREAQMHAEQLTYLFLRQIQIDEFLELIPRLHQLKTLDLADNELIELSDMFGALPKLDHLILQNNRLSKLPDFLPPGLKKLALGNNLLRTFPETLLQLPHLEWLDLSENQLTQIPDDIKKLKNLRQLFLSHNQLQALPPELGRLQHLKILDLEGNRLKSLPSFSQLKKLEQLNSGRNQISSLPSGISGCEQLSELNLCCNQLKKLPSGLFQLKFLRNLNLSDNQLSSLPARIGQLSWLASLDLSHNRLSRLTGKIGGCHQLQKLQLNHNQLSSLPSAIGQLKKLQQLQLDHNRLKRLPSLPASLKELSAANNHFDQFPASLHQLHMLEKLNLSANSIKQWPRTIKKLSSLKYLEINKGAEDFKLPTFLHLPPIDKIVCDRLRNEQLALLSDILNLTPNTKLSFQQKTALFFEQSEEKKLPISFLLNTLNKAGPHLSYSLRKKWILEKEEIPEISKGSKISLIGKPLLDIAQLQRQLNPLDITIESQAATPTILLLGEPPYPRLPKAYFQNLPWLNMRQLLGFIHQNSGSVLSNEQSLTVERLIRSDYPAQQKLGVQLIYGVGMDEHLWAFLYRIFRKKPEWPLKEELLSLLMLYAKEEQRKKLLVGQFEFNEFPD